MEQTSRRVEKRNRPPISCEPCRQRKLRCNRTSPCDTCTKRGIASTCFYAPNAIRSNAPQQRERNLKERLENLESLLTTWTSAGTGSPAHPNAQQVSSDQDEASVVAGPSRTSDLETTQSPNILTPQSTQDGRVNYVEATHWQSILKEIKEVREHLVDHPGAINVSNANHDLTHKASALGSFARSRSGMQIQELITHLPPRSRCDMLLSYYFNRAYGIIAVVHPEKFRQEYEKFQASPTSVDLLWLAELFAVLSVASSLRRLSHPLEKIDDKPSVPTMLQCTIHALDSGNYSRANSYALEAFLLHLQCLFLNRHTSRVDLWFQMGTMIRLAIRMGYHRDPDTLSGPSIFEGEMRRRTWLNLTQLDALLSHQTGFPSMIPVHACDTRLPRNLQYTDMHEDMVSLPPSRPVEERTPVLYSIVKDSILSMFKKIVAHTQSLSPGTHEQTMALDAEMRHAYNCIPQGFKRCEIARSFMDASGLIYERCTLEFLYHHGVIILHRASVINAARDSALEASRYACVEAALELLSRQIEIYQACQSGERLYDDRALFMALPFHDFLLAAMVTCLDLSHQSRLSASASQQDYYDVQTDAGIIRRRSHGRHQTYSSSISTSVENSSLRERQIQALRSSRRVWTSFYESLPDAQTAAVVIDVMIKSLAEPDQSHFQADSISSTMPFDTRVPFLHADTMTSMIDGTEDVDWGLLDQYLLDASTFTDAADVTDELFVP